MTEKKVKLKEKMENGVDEVAISEGVKNVHINSSGKLLSKKKNNFILQEFFCVCM